MLTPKEQKTLVALSSITLDSFWNSDYEDFHLTSKQQMVVEMFLPSLEYQLNV